MFFYNSRHTHRYPVADIKSIGPYPSGDVYERNYMSTVQLRGGGEVVVYDDQIDRFMPETSYLGTIPAAPGYSIVHVGLEEEPAWIARSPIIAWMVTHTGDLVPVTIAGTWDDLSPGKPIEMPDGRVHLGVDEGECDSVAVMVENMRAAQARKQEAAPKAEPAE